MNSEYQTPPPPIQTLMVLIICTKKESNLTNRYWDMVPDRQKVWMDGRKDGRTDDAKTIPLRLRWGMISIKYTTL